MVQKRTSDSGHTGRGRRGRPRRYNPDAALAEAIGAFWQRGYSATSLDDLSGATGMNRPSLYLAFGDKHALYIRALEHYWRLGEAGAEQALGPERSLREALRHFYRNALDFYYPPDGPPRGCFAISTATPEAFADPQIRSAFAQGLASVDRALEARIRLARDTGELPADAEPAFLAELASAVLYGLAIRARAGWSRASLEAFAGKAVEMICGR